MKDSEDMKWRKTEDGHVGTTSGTFEADVTEYDETCDIILISFETPAKMGQAVSEKLLAFLSSL